MLPETYNHPNYTKLIDFLKEKQIHIAGHLNYLYTMHLNPLSMYDLFTYIDPERMYKTEVTVTPSSVIEDIDNVIKHLGDLIDSAERLALAKNPERAPQLFPYVCPESKCSIKWIVDHIPSSCPGCGTPSKQ